MPEETKENAGGAQALIDFLRGALTSLEKNMIDKVDERARETNDLHTTNLNQLNLQLAEVQTKLDALTVMIADYQKSNAGEKRKTKTVTVAGGTAASPAKGAAATEPKGEKFPVNKMLFAKKKFKETEEYRKFITDEIMKVVPTFADSLETDVTIVSKKEDQRVNARAAFMWKTIKNNKGLDGLGNKIQQDYDQAKAEHNAQVQPTQETVEPTTPQEKKEG